MPLSPTIAAKAIILDAISNLMFYVPYGMLILGMLFDDLALLEIVCTAVLVPFAGASIAWAWRVEKHLSKLAFHFDENSQQSTISRINRHSDEIKTLKEGMEILQILEFSPELLEEMSKLMRTAAIVGKKHLDEKHDRNPGSADD